MYPQPERIGATREVVETVKEVGGIYFRSVLLQEGEVIDQHRHGVMHATYCGSGSARLWVNNKWKQDLHAGDAVEVQAGDEHMYQALENNTRLSCVFNAEKADRRMGG